MQALHDEIARMRGILSSVHSTAVPSPPDDDEGPDDGQA
jgi:hypothetical protein